MIAAVTCPQCRASLRASRPLPAGQAVRCPECGAHFTTAPAAPPFPPPPPYATPPAPPEPVLAPPARPVRVFGAAFFLAVASAFVLGGSIVAIAVLLTRERAPAVAEGAEGKGLDERRKLDEERARLERKEQEAKLVELRAAGQVALAKKDYGAAEKAFAAALKLSPNDGEALAGLLSARTGLEVAERARGEDNKRKADLKALLEQGRKALAEKRYAAGVRAFEGARALAPADPAVLEGLGKARDAAEADATQKKALAAYRKHMEAGKVAMEDERYPDAVREFLAALEAVPGDEDARDRQREAEKRLAAMKDREKRQAAFVELFEKARRALADGHFKEGIAGLEAALRLSPEDREAQRALRDARQAYKKAKSEYNKLLTQANDAAQAGRLEDAQRLYNDASKLLPDELAAARGLRDVTRMLEGARGAATAYQRSMDQAALALESLRYAEAVRAYTEALRLVPGDADALRGLRLARRRIEREGRAAADFDKTMRAAFNALARRQYGEAEKLFNDALRLDPENPRATRGLSDARYGRFILDGRRALAARRKQDAIDAFQSALDERPGDLTAKNGLQQARLLR